MEEVVFHDLGRIRYKTAWDFQTKLHRGMINHKAEVKKGTHEGDSKQHHHLLLCEHHPVFTLGKSGSLDNLLLSETELKEQDIDFFKINRGGDITYHGPGQVIGYPIFDMDCFFTDVHKYVRYLEEVVISVMKEYGIEGARINKYTGVWVIPENGPKRKICAIGVHMSRWVSMHGFAFNVNTDLDFFGKIIPCGIVDPDKTVTSLEQELGKPVSMEEVKDKVKFHFARLFGFSFAKEEL